jgi:hypothetical protein
MKYIKKYEKYNPSTKSYNVGDYVLMKGDFDLDNEEKYYKVVIIEVRDKKYFKYVVKDNEDNQYAIDDVNIIRKLTPKEIEIWKIKKDTDKYNL